MTGLLFFLAACGLAQAGTFGVLTYEINGDEITITDCDTNAVGTVVVPSVIEGKPVAIIDRHAFSGCRFMEEVTMPSSVTNIGYSAFYNCSSLGGIIIPSSVESLGQAAFRGCAELLSIDAEVGSSFYSSMNGVLFNADQTQIIFYPPGIAGSYSIPDGVVQIEGSAFADCDRLSKITVPPGITNIGSGAFSGCDLLTEVVLPVGVLEIEPHAFSYCDSLSEIIIPAGAERIGYYAFGKCPLLSEITIPSSVTSLVYNAFENSSGLLSIHVAAGNPQYSSVDGVLLSADQTELIKYPEGRVGAYTPPVEVAELGDNAFYKCDLLTEISFSSQFANIEGASFFRCNNLAAIHIEEGNPNYASIDGVVFNTNKTTLIMYPKGRAGVYTIPDGVRVIDGWAFKDCLSLTGLVIPADVETISSAAFSGCHDLKFAIFQGDALVWLFTSTFSDADAAFTIYYLSGSSGFTSPTWKGYSAVEIDAPLLSTGLWLLGHGFGYETNFDQDVNGDGVTLLMAYALNLDPTLDLSGSLPEAEIVEDAMGMTFYAASPGITYTVETSTDLETWTATGVSLSDLDPENLRTATTDLTAPHRFLRLRVEM